MEPEERASSPHMLPIAGDEELVLWRWNCVA